MPHPPRSPRKTNPSSLQLRWLKTYLKTKDFQHPWRSSAAGYGSVVAVASDDHSTRSKSPAYLSKEKKNSWLTLILSLFCWVCASFATLSKNCLKLVATFATLRKTAAIKNIQKVFLNFLDRTPLKTIRPCSGERGECSGDSRLCFYPVPVLPFSLNGAGKHC